MPGECRRQAPAMRIGTQFPTVTITLSLEQSPSSKENEHPVQMLRDKIDELNFTQPKYYIVVAKFGINIRTHI